MAKMHLPFNVGQIIEARSFQEGYRGAWFRCKIRDISNKKNVTRFNLEYLDFPDERIHSTKIYQKLQVKDKHLKEQRQLMVRPTFPLLCRGSEVLDNGDVLELVVAVNDVRKVGDLVDWWCDGCYWSGTLLKELGDEKFLIELFSEPFGEGLCYEASCNDLRPSLDWSLDNGWTVPFSENGEKGDGCARVIKSVNKGPFANLTTKNVRELDQDNYLKILASIGEESWRWNTPLKNRHRAISEKICSGIDCDVMEPRVDRVSGSCVTSDEVIEAVEANYGTKEDTDGPSKKLGTDGSILLNTMVSNTTEAAVMDLEELVSRIKWLKGMLTSNYLKSLDPGKSLWEVVDHRPTSTSSQMP